MSSKRKQNSMPQCQAASAKQPKVVEIPYYKTVKNSLANVVKNQHTSALLEKLVCDLHIHATYTLDFLKAYLLHCYHDTLPNPSLPTIDDTLVRNIMVVLAEKTDPDKRGSSGKMKDETRQLKARLGAFYDTYFASTVPANIKFRSENLSQVWQYFAQDVVKDYENNIKFHFGEYVQRFVNVVCQKTQVMEGLPPAGKAAFGRRLTKIKTEIIQGQTLSDADLASKFVPYLPRLLPSGRPITTEKTACYDVKVCPQAYLPCMIYMMHVIEVEYDSTIYNVFPMRNHMVPSYFRFDTAAIIKLLLEEKHLTKLGQTKGKLLNAVKANADTVWGLLFKTDMRCFGTRDKRYTFAHQIQTNGVAVSILWRDKLHENPPKKKEKESAELYIDDVSPSVFQGKTLVGIDPNKGDLIYCSAKIVKDGEEKQVNFRYTQDQRRKETKRKKFAKRQEALKRDTPISEDGRSVEEVEAILSQHKRKTLDLETFKSYLKAKHDVYNTLSAFYQQPRFRKDKWHIFINRQRSEAQMLNRFKEKFGPPSNTVVGFGDWEQKKQMKFKEPTMGKGMRRLFRRAGYPVYLTDEHKTSCQCHVCATATARCETFRQVLNPRPWMRGTNENITCHGLVRCNSCFRLWNRDVNSSLNILRLMEYRAAGRDRPEYLCRGGRSSASDASVANNNSNNPVSLGGAFD